MNSLFGTRLKALRDEKGKTQDDIAQLLGITRESYSGYERGKYVPPYKKISTLASIFDVSVDYLMGQTNFKNYEEKPPIDSDLRDIGIHLERMLDDLMSNMTVVKLYGKELKAEEKELLRSSVESAVKMAKLISRK